jgi:hypothetical protein
MREKIERPPATKVEDFRTLELGQAVLYDCYLIRTTERRGGLNIPEQSEVPHYSRYFKKPDDWIKLWQPRKLYGDGFRTGVVAGVRTLANGRVIWGTYDEPTEFSPEQHFPAAIVFTNMREKPVYVPLEGLYTLDDRIETGDAGIYINQKVERIGDGIVWDGKAWWRDGAQR